MVFWNALLPGIKNVPVLGPVTQFWDGNINTGLDLLGDPLGTATDVAGGVANTVTDVIATDVAEAAPRAVDQIYAQGESIAMLGDMVKQQQMQLQYLQESKSGMSSQTVIMIVGGIALVGVLAMTRRRR